MSGVNRSATASSPSTTKPNLFISVTPLLSVSDCPTVARRQTAVPGVRVPGAQALPRPDRDSDPETPGTLRAHTADMTTTAASRRGLAGVLAAFVVAEV